MAGKPKDLAIRASFPGPHDPAAMPQILFVCLGNICRSPLMEGIVRARWVGPDPVRLDSAGLGDWHAGEPPDPRAIAVASRHGIDLSGQRARAVVADDFRRFDLILGADRSILAALRQRAPRDARSECALFLDWTGVQVNGEVPDPYTGGESDFEAVFALIARGAAGLLARAARQRWSPTR